MKNIMYGGNANFYHAPLAEYAGLLDFLAESVGPTPGVLPRSARTMARRWSRPKSSRHSAYPTAMLLPMTFPHRRRHRDRRAPPHRRDGQKAVVYIKSANYLKPETSPTL